MPSPILRSIRLDPSWEGIDVDSGPNAIKKAKGYAVHNFLTGRRGRLYQRGGINRAAIAYGITNERICGTMEGKDRLLVGFKDGNDAARIVEPWVAPYRASAAAALATSHRAANGATIVDLTANTQAAQTPTTRSYVPGPRFTRFGKWAYGIAYDSDDDTAATIVDNGRGGNERLTRMIRWDTAAGVQPVIYTFAPYGAQDIRVHYSRLMVLGGRDPSTAGLKIEHNALWHTRVLSATDFDTGINSADANVGIWAEPETPTVTSKIALGGDQSDHGVALGAAGRHLAVFKRRSILVLSGFGPDSWQLRTFASGIGCLDPRSVCEANDGSFFMSAQGFMFFDGVQLIDYSEGMHNTLLAAALAAVGDEGTAGGFAITNRLTNDTVMLTIGNDGMGPATTPVITFAGILHVPTQSWSTFDSVLLGTTGAGPTWLGATENWQYIADHTNMYTIRNLATPEAQDESIRGKDGTNNIVTRWTSPLRELASPFARAKLNRIIIDYEWVPDAGAGGANGPLVEVYDGEGTLLDSFTLLSGADASQPPYRQRRVRELHMEVNDIMVKVTYTGVATFLARNSIMDVFVEFHPGQDRA